MSAVNNEKPRFYQRAKSWESNVDNELVLSPHLLPVSCEHICHSGAGLS